MTEPVHDHDAAELPATQHAIQFVGPGRLVHNRAKPVLPAGPDPGPRQGRGGRHLLLRHEAAPRVLGAIRARARCSAASTPARSRRSRATCRASCRPCRATRSRAGSWWSASEVRRHRVGERCLVQTDYRHLPTASANAAFGYNFEGGLQEYVLLDERMIIEPGTGERFLIPVGEAPSASAVALLEPWACVEASYARPRRGTLARGRPAAGRRRRGPRGRAGWRRCWPRARPAAVTVVVADEAQRGALVPWIAPHRDRRSRFAADDRRTCPPEAFDDIVYFGADADLIERLQALLAPRGVIDIVLGGGRIGRPVAVDVGRVHYDLTRWVGTPGGSAADGLRDGPGRRRAPGGGPRRGDRGGRADGPDARGPDRDRAAWPGIELVAVDIDDGRGWRTSRRSSGPLAAERGVPAAFLDSRTAPPEPGFSYVAVMVPAPALVAAGGRAGRRPVRASTSSRGSPTGTRAALDLDALIAKGVLPARDERLGDRGHEGRPREAGARRAGHRTSRSMP